MNGKEFSKALRGISKIDVEIGNPEDPVLARRQEKQIIELLKSMPAFSKFVIVGIEEWLRNNGHVHEIQKEQNKEESKYGDLVILDDSGKATAFIELKVGTKPSYYGACSITSLCNKLKTMLRVDGIPRIILAITSSRKFRVSDPLKMLNWLLNDPDAFLLRTQDKKKQHWVNDYTRKLTGKVRVGYSNSTASKENTVYGADFFPSFPFENHVFDF